MAHRNIEEDWNDDDSFDDDSIDDSSDDESTVPCPYCNRAIHEDSPRCPYCENYISAEDSPPARLYWLIILGTLATLAVICIWILH